MRVVSVAPSTTDVLAVLDGTTTDARAGPSGPVELLTATDDG